MSEPSPITRHVLALADTKRILGIRYSDWLLGSPSIETGIAASSMAQDEWGHARLLYAMLREFGHDPRQAEHNRAAAEYSSAPALDRPFADWVDFVVATVVIDGALTVALESFGDGSFALAQSRVPKMLAEEDFHRQFGDAWFARLATSDAGGRVRAAARSMLPSTLAWLLPDDALQRELEGEGLVWPKDRIAEALGARLNESLALCDLHLEEIEADRTAWDADRRRGPGAPGEEAVERARGDRNRALFVE